MLILSAHDLIERLPYTTLVRYLPGLLLRKSESPTRHVHTMVHDAEPDASLLLMPAWNADIGGVKIVNVAPGNAARSLPAVAASYLVFDAKTGEHKALLDGGELTARRTAAVAAIAADRLSSRQAHRLLLVGSGRIASELAFAYRAVRDIRTVEVFSPTHANAESLAHRLRDHGFAATAVRDLEAATHRADIVACATLSKTPLIHGAWLAPGQHVALIGGYTPDMRECDDAAMAKAQVWVDCAAALGEAGDLTAPLASGALRREHIRGTLSDLCAHGTMEHQENVVTLFKSVGEAAQDLAAAAIALR